MNQPKPVLKEDRLRQLARELDAVVRRQLPWYDGNQQDPGIALVELLAFVGDILAEYQDRIADEAYLQHPRAPRVAVTVDGSPWREVASLDSSGPGDAYYVVDVGADGSSTIRFGDGQQGLCPATGAQVAATYRTGAGGDRATVTISWPADPPLALEVYAGPSLIRFVPSRPS